MCLVFGFPTEVCCSASEFWCTVCSPRCSHREKWVHSGPSAIRPLLARHSSSVPVAKGLSAVAFCCREMQQHVAALQAELTAAQAAADLEATLKEFKNFIDNGQQGAGLSAAAVGSSPVIYNRVVDSAGRSMMDCSLRTTSIQMSNARRTGISSWCLAASRIGLIGS